MNERDEAPSNQRPIPKFAATAAVSSVQQPHQPSIRTLRVAMSKHATLVFSRHGESERLGPTEMEGFKRIKVLTGISELNIVGCFCVYESSAALPIWVGVQWPISFLVKQSWAQHFLRKAECYAGGLLCNDIAAKLYSDLDPEHGEWDWWELGTSHLDGETGKDKSWQVALGHCWVARGFEAQLHGFSSGSPHMATSTI